MKKYNHNLKTLILRHLLSKDEDQGFVLIFLALMLGLVSAIALPSFLNQASKAKQSEAKTYVGSMNRGKQKACFIGFTRFSSDKISQLICARF